jgi:hypothetical protein
MSALPLKADMLSLDDVLAPYKSLVGPGVVSQLTGNNALAEGAGVKGTLGRKRKFSTPPAPNTC